MRQIFEKPHGPRFINREGQRFGRLLVLRFAELRHHQAVWTCLCACGKEVKIHASSLSRGLTKSCGCFNSEVARRRLTTHGKTKTKAFRAWMSIKGRCYNPNIEMYPHYGGRGVVMCDRWLESFENFLADMGEPPTPKHSVERKDNNGNYEPSNCKWATKQEQSRNTRRNKFITYQGVTRTLVEWCETLGLVYSRTQTRFAMGWSAEDAFERKVWSRKR